MGPDRHHLAVGRAIPSGTLGTDGTPFPELPDEPLEDVSHVYTGDVPVIVGHYWDTGELEVYGPKVACVDYSAGKGGPLVAYRWDGEPNLVDAHFVSF